MAPEPSDEEPSDEELSSYGLTEEQLAMIAKLPAFLRRPLPWLMSHWPGRVALRIASGLQRIQIFDRAMTIAAQLFTSVFPILIMGASIFGGRATGDAAADSIELPAETADVLDDVVAAGGIGTFGIVGILVVLVSATSLSRALTRAYDAVWQHGKTKTKVFEVWRWLAAVFVLALAFLAARVVVQYTEPIPPRNLWSTAVSFCINLGIAAFIPWLLMAARVPARWLMSGAWLFAVVMLMAQPISAAYLPIALESSAEKYGSIGVAFTYLTYLYMLSFALLGCAVIGYVITTDEGGFGRFVRGTHAPGEDFAARRAFVVDEEE